MTIQASKAHLQAVSSIHQGSPDEVSSSRGIICRQLDKNHGLEASQANVWPSGRADQQWYYSCFGAVLVQMMQTNNE